MVIHPLQPKAIQSIPYSEWVISKAYCTWETKGRQVIKFNEHLIYALPCAKFCIATFRELYSNEAIHIFTDEWLGVDRIYANYWS